ncbi:APC family permease [Sutterella sp.]|uniref:APC family permease n=1 Tax=Sutterella sp. TaxID=1981025 RepID=UPI0026E03F69|nr:amino acid permease [Sutterella sp.]MDO5530971.1 amino acid permease [Sutterella sp.]
MTDSPTPHTPGGQVTMRREVGLFGGISVLAGIMIGSGIFYIGGIVLERSGDNLGLALLVWCVGGLITLLSGICFAELGAMMPKAGGYYVYLHEAYGERVAIMCGITNFFLSSSGSISALALAFAAAISSMYPLGIIEQKTIAVVSVIVLSLINMRGIKLGSTVQNIFMVLKLLPIALIIVCGLFMGEQHPDLFHFPAETPELTTILSMMAFAVLATLWAYEGWSNLNTIAEEMKNPKRNIPLSLILSILGVATLYVLFNYSVYRVLPYDAILEMVKSGNFYLGTAAAQELFGGLGMLVVGTAMMLAIFNSLNGCIMVFPRMYFAMARDGALFPALAKLHPTYRTPINAQIASMVMSIILICSRSLSELTSLVAISGLIFHGLTFLSVIVLRRKYPTLERPYKVWFYPWSIILVVTFMLALIINTIYQDPVTAALGIFVPIVGLGIWEIFFRRRHPAEGSGS